LSIGQGADESQAVLIFSDDGAGIEAKNIDRVFDPFFTTKGLHAGGQRMNPGLGLSVVQGIVLEMGGRITVKPGPQSGTEFTITLPVNSLDDSFDD